MTTTHSITAEKVNKRLIRLNFENSVHMSVVGRFSDTVSSKNTDDSRDVMDSPMRSPHIGGSQRVA